MQRRQSVPRHFLTPNVSTYLACMLAGTGILGTGGGGSPYRAKLKLLQILDR